MHRIIHSSSPLDLERHSHNIIYSSQTVYLLILSGEDGLCPTFALGFFALKIYFLINQITTLADEIIRHIFKKISFENKLFKACLFNIKFFNF